MDNNIYLFLDDERHPQDVFWVDWIANPSDWTVVRSYDDFVEWVQTHGLPAFISFDHDLGQTDGVVNKTGYDCAKWLVDWCLDHNLTCPMTNVHSKNQVGAVNIAALLDGFRKFQHTSKPKSSF